MIPIKASTKRPASVKPRKKEITGLQSISLSYGLGILSRDYSRVGTYRQLRVVRKDPTVQLARGMLISCIQAGNWNVEADEDVSEDVTEFIKHILPLREDFLYNVVAYGKVDYGWCGFEKIFGTDGSRIYIESLKPLLHDITTILVTKQGHFNGYRQTPVAGEMVEVDVPPEKCLHIAFGVEAGNYYGMPLLENIRQAMDDWSDCNDGAKRYDLKLAGSHWVIKYPPGTTTVDDESVDNGEIAARVLDALMSSGSVAIPTTSATVIQELTGAGVANIYAWDVSLLSDSGGRQESFGKRLSYLDSQKVRGLLMPERTLLEGEHGTKAEAATHLNLALNNFEASDRGITRMFNRQLVDQLVELNFGRELVGKVRLVSAPLVDEQLSFLQKVYANLDDPDIDVGALRDKMNIPSEKGGSKGLKKTNLAEQKGERDGS